MKIELTMALVKRLELKNKPVGLDAKGSLMPDDPAELHSLSDREITVFRLIGQGLKKGDIARELSLSPHTVETYRSNIKKKLGLASGAELYRQAFLRSELR